MNLDAADDDGPGGFTRTISSQVTTSAGSGLKTATQTPKWCRPRPGSDTPATGSSFGSERTLRLSLTVRYHARSEGWSFAVSLISTSHDQPSDRAWYLTVRD